MKNYNLRISERQVTGFGVGPITNENTLIKFVLKISKKLKNWSKQMFGKHMNSKPSHIEDDEQVPIFI